MSTDEQYKWYVRDVVYSLRERGAEAAQTAASSDSDFHRGAALAYREVLSRMKNEAVTFELPLDEIGLAFDPFHDDLAP